MFKEKSFNVLIFCIIVTVSAAVLQYLNPNVSIFDGGLIIAILLTIFLNDDHYTLIFGGISALLIVGSIFYEHEGVQRQQVIIQHAYSLIIVIMTVIFVMYVKKLYLNIEAEQMQVNALFEHATEGIILTDDKGKIILLNPAAEALVEYKKDDLLGKSIEILIPGRFHAHHTHYRDGFYKHPSNRSMGHGRDLFARKKNGKEFPVEVSLSFYRQKNTFFVIAFLVDITQRKQAEKELLDRKTELEKITQDISRLNAELESKVEQRTLILREALQELERSQEELNEALNKEKELSEIKSRFVSMASHEFRTPLSTVLSSAALISKYTLTEDQDKRDKHIRRIKDSVKHLNELLGDFLSLGRLEEGRIQAEMAAFPVREFLDEVVEEMRSLARPGQTIHCDSEGVYDFISDKRLLRNVLINLLSNASKFSAEGAGIWLKARHTPESITISVRDEGIGISAEDQQHLFSSFFRGANAVNIEGTGLGLHIVKRYVELVGGSMQLESVLDKGTTITIEVPMGTLADKIGQA
jgi:PAS domain S-box-containing protein